MNDQISVGRIEGSVDSSGRFQIPSEWLEKTGQEKRVYVMPDPAERCLRLILACNMELWLEKMRERAIIDPVMNRALQVLGGVAEVVEVDADGCVEISSKLLEFAGITNQLVMVGGEWYAQLWNPRELSRKESE